MRCMRSILSLGLWCIVQVDSVNADLNKLRESLSSAQSLQLTTAEALTQCEAAVHKATSERDDLSARVEKASAELVQAQSQCGQIRQQIASTQERVKMCEKELRARDEALTSLKADCSAAKQKGTTLTEVCLHVHSR